MPATPLDPKIWRGNYPLTVGKESSRLVDQRFGGPIFYLNPPEDIGMRLPDELLNCVGFFAHDEPVIRYGGTGFFIAVRGRWNNAYVHLVTAKHVAEALEGVPHLFSVNSRTHGPITLRGGNTRWWYHPTEADSVDVAVTIFAPDPVVDPDIHFVPENVVASPGVIKKRNIGVGDEINAVGLFTKFHGSSRHMPIVRTGNIAMMPSDRIPVARFGEMEAYLAEGRSIGGLSGSPVFVRHMIYIDGEDAAGEKAQVCGLSGRIHLLGLMHGHWDLPVGFLQGPQAEAVNMGISIIVPAHKIMEVINHPELVEMRKRTDDKLERENHPKPDSALGPKSAPKLFTKDDFESALKKVTRKVDKQ